MPKKKTKIKTKTEKVKAVAKTKKGGAQAQVQNVVVKIGDTKKRPRRKAPPKKKSEGTGKPTTFPPSGDGWFPPQNLMRNGATFAGAEQIRYVNVPTPAQTSFVAGGAVQPPTFVPPPEPIMPEAPIMPEEPDMQSGYDATFAPEADSGINMTEFLRQWKQPRERERQNYILSEEEEKSFAPPVAESPTFAEPVEEQPTFMSPIPKKSAPHRFPPPPPSSAFLTPMKDETQTPKSAKKTPKFTLVNQIYGGMELLQNQGLVEKSREGRRELYKELFGEDFSSGKDITKYNVSQLVKARENLAFKYGI